MFRCFKIIGTLVCFLFLFAGCSNSSNPTIASFTPANGLIGTTVTITGTNFSTTPSGNTVAFNGIAATVVSSTTTQIVTTVPPGATTGPITVTVQGISVTTTTNFTMGILMGGSIQGFPTSLAGTVSTLVGTGTFTTPFGLTTDGTNLYVSDDNNGAISKIVIATGVVTTLVGTGTFTAPTGLTTDGTNLYVSDTTGSVSKIVISTAAVTTLDAAGTFNAPAGITTDGTHLYVCNSGAGIINKVQ